MSDFDQNVLQASNELEETNNQEPGRSQARIPTNMELRRLGATNPSGGREEIASVDGRRRRGSTVSSARVVYDIKAQELRYQMDDFDEKQTLGRLTSAQLGNEYFKLKTMEGLLVRAADEII